MTTEPYAYTDPDGDLLHVGASKTGLLLVAEIIADEDAPPFRAPVCIPAADVRKVTAVMHEKAGLPDRWAALRDRLEYRAEALRAVGRDVEVALLREVLELMDGMEAGR